ncbi:MAG: hypothetical protein WBD20_03770 [Pirellulaceae bacterium]
MNPLRDFSAKVSGWIEKWLASKTCVGEAELPAEFDIEFLGGPLDGHRETISRNRFACMPDWIEIPISRAQFDLLEGIEPKSYSVPTSVAVYDLVRVAAQWRFRFRQQVPARRMRDRSRP